MDSNTEFVHPFFFIDWALSSLPRQSIGERMQLARRSHELGTLSEILCDRTSINYKLVTEKTYNLNCQPQ
jgi:hypothetical protein